jgi:replicative DNA helicase
MQRANKRPINSDLRDSGQIEADSDLIFFPFYEKLFDEESKCGPFAEVICSKNRHGKAETTYARVTNGVWASCDQVEARNVCLSQ